LRAAFQGHPLPDDHGEAKQRPAGEEASAKQPAFAFRCFY